MIVNKKEFTIGLILTVIFAAIFAYMWTPSFNGKNAFEASDDIFNSMSKGSCYQLTGLMEQAEGKAGTPLNASFKLDDAAMADKAAVLYQKAGADVVVNGNEVIVKGDLGAITVAAITDSDEMYYNNNDKVTQKYGYDAKEAMYYWWLSFDKMNKSLQNSSDFATASFVTNVKMKAVELGYNFNGIEGQSAKDNMGLLSFLLIFYVIYTIIWGCAILFLFEGFGVMMVGHAKKA